ncbi:MAG: HAD-IIIC family phosphatase [Chloroflexota bacterium]
MSHIEQAQSPTNKTIKCVVWDLDNTLWDGTLLEDSQVHLRDDVVTIIKTLDQRGVLHSIASKNHHELAMQKLEEFGLADYFLYPQIHWNSKATSLEAIAKAINIGIDTLAFVDDQAFERDEVAHQWPQVLCIDSADRASIVSMPEMMPRFITDDSRVRRQMYLSDIARNQAEQDYVGPSEAFLATLDMVFTITEAREADLQRAEELTVRTNQLNTTGYTYSYEELNTLRQSSDHKLLIASLEDCYGTYGKIGLALVECGTEYWMLKLLLMSCRVMSRGVGSIMMGHVMRLAKESGVPLRAEFVANDRNRMMLVTYKFGGFKAITTEGALTVFEHDLTTLPPIPAYVTVHVGDTS